VKADNLVLLSSRWRTRTVDIKACEKNGCRWCEICTVTRYLGSCPLGPLSALTRGRSMSVLVYRMCTSLKVC